MYLLPTQPIWKRRIQLTILIVIADDFSGAQTTDHQIALDQKLPAQTVRRVYWFFIWSAQIHENHFACCLTCFDAIIHQLSNYLPCTRQQLSTRTWPWNSNMCFCTWFSF